MKFSNKENGDLFVQKVLLLRVPMLLANKWAMILEKHLETLVLSKLVIKVMKTFVSKIQVKSKLQMSNVLTKKNLESVVDKKLIDAQLK